MVVTMNNECDVIALSSRLPTLLKTQLRHELLTYLIVEEILHRIPNRDVAILISTSTKRTTTTITHFVSPHILLVWFVLLFDAAVILSVHNYGFAIQNGSLRCDSTIRGFNMHALQLELRRYHVSSDQESISIVRNDSFQTARIFVTTLVKNNMR